MGTKCLFGNEVSTWGRSVYLGMKCLHRSKVSTWGRSVYLGMKCLHRSKVSTWGRSVYIGIQLTDTMYNQCESRSWIFLRCSNFHIDGVVWCVVGCWLVGWLGGAGGLCILLCPCWRPHQPAGTQAAPPHGAAPRTFSPSLITRLLYTQRRMLSLPTFVLHCVCLLICVCVCLQFSAHPSSHSALHDFQKFTGLMQKWHMVFLDFTIILNDESKYTSYFL
jgi:hypothetical protein